MLKELRSEIIYVLTIWIILTWGLMLIDIQHHWRTQEQGWEYVITPEDAWAIAATNGGRR